MRVAILLPGHCPIPKEAVFLAHRTDRRILTELPTAPFLISSAPTLYLMLILLLRAKPLLLNPSPFRLVLLHFSEDWEGGSLTIRQFQERR